MKGTSDADIPGSLRASRCGGPALRRSHRCSGAGPRCLRALRPRFHAHYLGGPFALCGGRHLPPAPLSGDAHDRRDALPWRALPDPRRRRLRRHGAPGARQPRRLARQSDRDVRARHPAPRARLCAPGRGVRPLPGGPAISAVGRRRRGAAAAAVL